MECDGNVVMASWYKKLPLDEILNCNMVKLINKDKKIVFTFRR